MSKIITTEDLEDYTGKDLNSAQAEAVVDAINAWIENRTSRCWGETKQVTERYNYKQVVWLRHADIVSVDTVTLGWPGQTQTAVTSDWYYFNTLGRLSFYATLSLNYNPTSRLLKDYMAVTYTYGLTEVPAD